jgi:3'(2'), 5'-bisphosphate nucleotidase
LADKLAKVRFSKRFCKYCPSFLYMSPADLIEDLQQIARQAGQIILDIYLREADFQVQAKADDSPLTIADRQANAYICEALENLPLSFPIISEENREIAYAERSQFERCWLVDPLDGTKEFVSRNGDFTVNIALINGKGLELGVVYVPLHEELYWAVRGQGAFWQKNGQIEALRCAQFNLKDEGLALVASRSHLNEETELVIAQFVKPTLVSRGSSLKFLMLAKGEAHVYPRLAPTMEWDTGAAQIILEEAGGAVIDHERGLPLQYNKVSLRNPAFIAYGQVRE